MKILADTHILIWSLMGNDKLSDSARNIILDPNNTIYYSLFSIWEIAIKVNLHPDAFSFSTEDFDRILLAQAKSEGMIFLTHDTRIKYYGENCVWEV